jgi:hypothetical protein
VGVLDTLYDRLLTRLTEQDANNTDVEASSPLPNDPSNTSELSPTVTSADDSNSGNISNDLGPQTVADDHVLIDDSQSLHATTTNEANAENASPPLTWAVANAPGAADPRINSNETAAP